MNVSNFKVGLKHSESMYVKTQNTVPHLEQSWPGFQDMPEVFATAMMIGFMEQTCIQALRPFLAENQHSVGTHVDISHVSATPVGFSVTALIELVEVDGRILTFKVSCQDDFGIIGEGTHKRAIIDVPKFLERLKNKLPN